MIHSRVVYAAAATAALSLVGCVRKPTADYAGFGLLDVSGTVQLDGEPLSGAVVTFDAPDGTFSYAMTDDRGGYTLKFDSLAEGVPPGPKTVRISTSRKLLGLNAEEDGGEQASDGEAKPRKRAGRRSQTPAAPAPPAGERVPAKYNQDSGLLVHVDESQTRFDFDLHST